MTMDMRDMVRAPASMPEEQRKTMMRQRRFIYSGAEGYLSARECLKLRLVDEVGEFLDERCLPDPAPSGGRGNNG